MAVCRAALFKVFRISSNAGAGVGGRQRAIDGQAAGSRWRIGDITGVIMYARPRPTLRTVCQSRLHRVHQQEAVFLAAFVDNPAQAGEFRGRRIPRQVRRGR